MWKTWKGKPKSKSGTKLICIVFFLIKVVNFKRLKGYEVYASSTGVAMILANITVGAWQADPSNAKATPHRNTGTPVLQQKWPPNKRHCNLKSKSSKLRKKKNGERHAPHIGNIPKVIPSAAEKASCFGSVPLRQSKKRRQNQTQITLKKQHFFNRDRDAETSISNRCPKDPVGATWNYNDKASAFNCSKWSLFYSNNKERDVLKIL